MQAQRTLHQNNEMCIIVCRVPDARSTVLAKVFCAVDWFVSLISWYAGQLVLHNDATSIPPHQWIKLLWISAFFCRRSWKSWQTISLKRPLCLNTYVCPLDPATGLQNYTFIAVLTLKDNPKVLVWRESIHRAGGINPLLIQGRCESAQAVYWLNCEIQYV